MLDGQVDHVEEGQGGRFADLGGVVVGGVAGHGQRLCPRCGQAARHVGKDGAGVFARPVDQTADA